MADNNTTIGTLSSLGKAVTGVGAQVSDMVRRQDIGGNVGGSIYGLVWGELSEMLNIVLGLNISDTAPSFGDKMYGYMFRLMAINKFEKDLTLATIAQGAYINGNPDGLPVSALFPLYSNIVNDYPAFVRGAAANELNGIDSTWKNTVSTDGTERIETVNLYPDDLDIGTFENKWQLDNRNSILEKTKNLFNKGKINSLISRFGTKADGEPDVDFNGKVGYTDLGMSRGKNLRRAPNSGEYSPNGYNNPYCRVWTHHHQYDRYSKTIRPFASSTTFPVPTTDGSGYETWTDTRQITMGKLHTWDNAAFAFNEETDGEWGWKNNNAEWSHSVLNQQDGLVNITPKYDNKQTIHTKDCMFSIENLAWKDYDPYTFEKALSWEQRGPLGGRIMWFPPYGISFTETTNVQWNESTFIGRGENVYTYTNTTRSGTLSFMMLTDHPSVTDYASWSQDDKGIDDDMWNRFFAGCDSLDGNDEYSIMHYVQPTPMDYIFESRPDNPNQQTVDEPEKPTEETPSDAVEEVSFFVFFPNYYTGRESTLFNKESTGMYDFSIAYLLGGVNAQKSPNTQFDEQISFKYSLSSAFTRGYEMNTGVGNGITTTTGSNVNNNIIGNQYIWHDMPLSELEGKPYMLDDNKKWYYRIDGRYHVPETEEEKITNQYSHKLATSNSYKDTQAFGLNLSIDNIDPDMCPNKENLYSFAEFSYAMAKYMPSCEGVSTYLESKLDNDREDKIEALIALLDKEVESVDVVGYANSQGYADENKLLAEHRAQTIVDWIKWYNGDISGSDNVSIKSEVKTVSSKDENSRDAKKWRSVKCTIRFKTDETTVNNKDNEEFENISEETVENVAKDTGVSLGQVKQVLKEAGYLEENDELSLSAEDLKYMYDKMNKENSRLTEGKTSGLNKIRYDNEMFFYKKFKAENPFKWKKLSDKLQYFDPAFHSMTPEGFNMRLTFLEQCTRQGDTMSASDPKSKSRTASNMAFGRPPFCVLRLGDFFNQLIVIKSITKSYDDDGALTWDLNDEGVGAQPMIARITISFDFIGGGDLAGPVRRLQNAMSFNYYANASLYDNRADRMYYEAEEHLSTAMGGNPENSQPSIPRVGQNGKILDKKGTYSVFNSIEKFHYNDEETKTTTN